MHPFQTKKLLPFDHLHCNITHYVQLAFLTLIFLFTQQTSNSHAQTVWTKYENNPIVDAGPEGSWDSNGAAHPAVLKRGSTYLMWYSGFDADGFIRIGHARSNDGIHWKKYKNNPVIDLGAPGEWDDFWINAPKVIFHHGKFHLWYWGVNTSGFGGSAMGYATSRDGIHWEKHPANPVMVAGPEGAWDDFYVSNGDVLYQNGTFRMWYGGFGNEDFTEGSIGLAMSEDGVEWHKHPRSPVMTPGDPGEWDEIFDTGAEMYYDGSIYHMWFHGFAPFQIGYATSINGKQWKKYENNPILTPGSTGDWDEMWVIQPSVIVENNLFKMWHTGVDSEGIFRIGYATSPPTQPIAGKTSDLMPEESLQVTDSSTPESAVLYPNYPNPFNPSTSIQYQLEKDTFVSLKVYNLLGQEIKTLVSGFKSAGDWSATWDGTDASNTGVPSGTYIYKMIVGDHIQTGQMVFLK